MTDNPVSRRKRMRQRISPDRVDRLGNSGNTLQDSQDGSSELTDGRKERVRSLLIEAVILLCKNSVFYQTELTIEGLLGVTVDTKDVFLVNINQKVNNPSSTVKPDPRGDDNECIDITTSNNRSTHPLSTAWMQSSETMSPPYPKRHKGKTKYRNVIPINPDSPQTQHISTTVDRKIAVYQADEQFETNTSEIVVIKSEPGCEDKEGADYANNIYKDVNQQMCGGSNDHSDDGIIEPKAGHGNITRRDYHTNTGAANSSSSSPQGRLPSNVHNWDFPADTNCDQDNSVTHLQHSDNDETFESYIARSAIFPIAISLPARLGKVDVDSEMATVNQLSIDIATQQGMSLPTGGVDMNYSPTSSKGSEPIVSSTLWNELQQQPSEHPSDDGEYSGIVDQTEGTASTNNALTEIRGSANMSNCSVASNCDGQSTVCKICGKMLASRTVYSRHLKTHLGRYFTCQICSRQFNRKDNLKRHYALLHQVPAGCSSTLNMNNEQTVEQPENSNETGLPRDQLYNNSNSG